MAKSLLNCVNQVLKRVKIIQGDSSALTTLTDSPRQNYIDVAVQVWNEAIEQLYDKAKKPLPQVMSNNTITLVTSDRDYALQTDLNKLFFPLIDETNGDYIWEYPGDYLDLINDQPIPANETGLPDHGVISPENNQLYLNRLPTANEDGRVYKYRYEKDISLAVATDTVPFNDKIFRAMVPVVAQLWSRDQRRDFDDALYKINLGRATRSLTQVQPKETWTPERVPTAHFNMTDPFNGD